MLNQADVWKHSQGAALTLAVVSSLFFVLLFWIWERDLLWMLAAVLPPIWSPLIYRRFTDDARKTDRIMVVGALLLGLTLLFGLGLFLFMTG